MPQTSLMLGKAFPKQWGLSISLKNFIDMIYDQENNKSFNQKIVII